MAVATLSFGTEQCPLIRPAGLTPAQIDQLIVSKLSDILEIEPRQIDKSRTIKALDKTGKGIMHYAVFVVFVGESLGFDSAALFYTKAKQKGSDQPFESVTIEEFQALSRIAYEKGNDSPPPVVTENSAFKLHKISVRSPSPPDGWVMLRCMSDQIAFQRRSEPGITSTAAARTLTLPSFVNEGAFIAYTTSTTRSTLSRLGSVQSFETHAVSASSVPCVEFTAVVDAAATPYTVWARFCYADTQSQFGYSAMFSHQGIQASEKILTESRAFIDGASPK